MVLAVASYNLFAKRTRVAPVPVRPGSPSGQASDLQGLGSMPKFPLISLALMQRHMEEQNAQTRLASH
eukprot:770560-Karenia_brevis.AAC.1